MTFIQHKVVPFLAQQVVLVDTYTSVCGQKDSITLDHTIHQSLPLSRERPGSMQYGNTEWGPPLVKFTHPLMQDSGRTKDEHRTKTTPPKGCGEGKWAWHSVGDGSGHNIVWKGSG